MTSTRSIQVVGEATNGRDALALVERLMPHVAVLDLDMPQMDVHQSQDGGDLQAADLREDGPLARADYVQLCLRLGLLQAE